MTIAKLGMSKGKYKVPNKGVFYCSLKQEVLKSIQFQNILYITTSINQCISLQNLNFQIGILIERGY